MQTGESNNTLWLSHHRMTLVWMYAFDTAVLICQDSLCNELRNLYIFDTTFTIHLHDRLSQDFMWRWHRWKPHRGFLLWLNIILGTLELWRSHGRLLHEPFDFNFCSSWISSTLSNFTVAYWSNSVSIPTWFLLEVFIVPFTWVKFICLVFDLGSK
jgi:hypothetical protein